MPPFTYTTVDSVPWSPDFVNISICDQTGLAQSADFVANTPPLDAISFANIPGHFEEGAQITNTFTTIIITNVGTISVPNFVSLPVQVIPPPPPAGITALVGDILAAGSGSVSSIIDRIKGLLVNASMASAFTGEFIQYTGNSSKGWINASHRAATAVSGAVTVTGEGGNYEITTDSLSLAPGDTYTLEIIGLILTGGTNSVTDITWGTATQGQCKVVKKVKTGGAITFTIQNVDTVNTCNGTFIINMLAV